MKKQPWELRMDAIDKRLDRLVAIQEASEKRHATRMDRIDDRLDKVASRLDSISKLMKIGASHLIRMEDAQRKFFENVNRGNGIKK